MGTYCDDHVVEILREYSNDAIDKQCTVRPIITTAGIQGYRCGKCERTATFSVSYYV